MKVTRITAFAALLLLVLSPFFSGTYGEDAEAIQYNAHYVSALSIANQFLEAWRTRDLEQGLSVLSSTLRSSKSEDEWFILIVGTSNPHHQAYEIGPGRTLPQGRFAFDVWLYEQYTGQGKDEPLERPKPSTLILKQSKDAGWVIDEFIGF